MTFEKTTLVREQLLQPMLIVTALMQPMQQRILALLTDIAQINHNLIIQNKK